MQNSDEIHAEKARPNDGLGQEHDIDEKVDVAHADHVAVDLHTGAAKSVGLAVIGQTHTIPTTGERKVTSKFEYWSYCAFYLGAQGNPIAFSASSQLQLMLSLQFPDGLVSWGARSLSISATMLNLTGIIFAIQFVSLLFIGAYADFGNWRPYLLIGFMGLCYCCQFSISALDKPAQWVGATTCYVIGVYAMNMVIAFYAATFPGLVQDLPEVIESEKGVLEGTVAPETHDRLVSYNRSKLNNLLNVTGSSLQIVSSACALGIAQAIGYATDAQILQSYRVLMGFLSACTVLVTVPFFIAQKHRPGQQLPAGVSMFRAGPQQVWSAMRSVKYLKQVFVYLFAYFMLQETYGTYYGVVGILQNDVIKYSPALLNGMNIVGSVAGGSGNLLVFLLQRKYRFATKKGVCYGAFMTLVPNLWGAIGAGTNVIGFHKEWEFWMAQAWNFQMAAWSSYQIAFLAELVPAPKAYLFFALFNTVGKTSGFIGPFASAGITTRAGGNTNMSFIFLFCMGLIGFIVLLFVDVDKAKLDSQAYLEKEARELYSDAQRHQAAEETEAELHERVL